MRLWGLALGLLALYRLVWSPFVGGSLVSGREPFRNFFNFKGLKEIQCKRRRLVSV